MSVGSSPMSQREAGVWTPRPVFAGNIGVFSMCPLRPFPTVGALRAEGADGFSVYYMPSYAGCINGQALPPSSSHTQADMFSPFCSSPHHLVLLK